MSVTEAVTLPDETRVEAGINRPDLYDPNTGAPIHGGLSDPRLGDTFDLENPGYFGHMNLTRPVYHIGVSGYDVWLCTCACMDILSLFCRTFIQTVLYIYVSILHLLGRLYTYKYSINIHEHPLTPIQFMNNVLAILRCVGFHSHRLLMDADGKDKVKVETIQKLYKGKKRLTHMLKLLRDKKKDLNGGTQPKYKRDGLKLWMEFPLGTDLDEVPGRE